RHTQNLLSDEPGICHSQYGGVCTGLLEDANPTTVSSLGPARFGGGLCSIGNRAQPFVAGSGGPSLLEEPACGIHADGGLLRTCFVFRRDQHRAACDDCLPALRLRTNSNKVHCYPNHHYVFVCGNDLCLVQISAKQKNRKRAGGSGSYYCRRDGGSCPRHLQSNSSLFEVDCDARAFFNLGELSPAGLF